MLKKIKMTCKNCKTNLILESDYCYKCGGKIIRNRLTIKSLFKHFGETFLNYDNKFLQTFIHLFTKPENVIGGYINGVRKKHVNVISYFAIALTLTGIEWYILNNYFPDLVDISNLAIGKGQQLTNDTFKVIQEHLSIIMMLFVPAYALISRIVFFNKKDFNYTEHVVIFMYVLAQLSIFGAILNLLGVFIGIPIGKLVYINLPLQIIYSAYCLKRLYKLSLTDIFLRTLLFVGVFLIFYVLAIISTIAIIFLVKGSDFFKEAFEAQKTISSLK